MPSLGEELSALRKKENLTLKNIFDSTRIPLDVLKSIEDSSIFKDPHRNKTYVRSFVRTYAKALKIDEPDIILALDQTYKDKYDGLIARNYGLSSWTNKMKGTESEEKKKDYKPKFALETPQEKEEPDEEKDKPDEKKPKEEKEEPEIKDQISTPSGTTFEYSKPDSSQSHVSKTPDQPNIHNVNWVEMSDKVSDFKSKTPITLIAAVIIIILAAASYFVYIKYETPSGSTKSNNELKSVLPVDTTKTQAGTAADSMKAANKATLTLPDTLHLIVYAAYDKLEPVRVKSDLANRLNPYWVEKGQAMRYRFLNDIYIRGQYSRMMILFRGHPIPNIDQYKQSDGTIHLQRSMLEKHKDWYKMSNQGPLPNDVPWPSVIHNVPTF